MAPFWGHAQSILSGDESDTGAMPPHGAELWGVTMPGDRPYAEAALTTLSFGEGWLGLWH